MTLPARSGASPQNGPGPRGARARDLLGSWFQKQPMAKMHPRNSLSEIVPNNCLSYWWFVGYFLKSNQIRRSIAHW